MILISAAGCKMNRLLFALALLPTVSARSDRVAALTRPDAPPLAFNDGSKVTLTSFAYGELYTPALEYFRSHAPKLGFSNSLLWNKTDLESDPLFAGNMTHLLTLQNELRFPSNVTRSRAYCCGFKALMLWRAMEKSNTGDYVM